MNNDSGDRYFLLTLLLGSLAVVYAAALIIGRADLFRATAPVLAACIAVAGVARSISQKRQADERAEWWKRTQWALDNLHSDSLEKQKVAEAVLFAQLDESTCREEDAGLMRDIAVSIFELERSSAEDNLLSPPAQHGDESV